VPPPEFGTVIAVVGEEDAVVDNPLSVAVTFTRKNWLTTSPFGVYVELVANAIFE
jgi:hypothetical protein